MSRTILFPVIIVAIVSTVAEIGAYGAGRILAKKAVFYEAPALDQLASYFEHRDPVLGWPAPNAFGGNVYDRSGSRHVPEFSEVGGACVSAYGDSFTYAVGVADEEAWPNQLSKLLGCRVANYGVGGYGSDQATIRFENNNADEASVVILTHLSENILRNVNQYRKLLSANNDFGLKPRFALGDTGDIELVPIPIDTPDDFVFFAQHPEDFLTNEYFAPGGASGIQHQRFPFTISLLRAFGHFHVRATLAGLPSYAEFYQPDHPSTSLELTARILERFTRSAQERGKLAILQIIPTGSDLVEYQRTGRWIYQPLKDRAQELGLDVVDLGEELMKVIEDSDPCAIFLECNGHFNAEGNRLLAHAVRRALEARHLS